MNRMALFVVVLLLARCAYHPPRGTTPQTGIGPAGDFGLRITQVARPDIDYLIEQPAYVVAIRVTDDRSISVFAPPANGRPLSQSGHHYVRGGDFGHWEVAENTVTVSGQSYDCTNAAWGDGVQQCGGSYSYTMTNPTFVPDRDQPSGYWLLIASDLPMSQSEVLHRIGGLNRSDTSVVSLVRKIPEALIASRTGHWAASYAAFGQSQDP